MFFFKNRYYTEEEFLDKLNELWWFLEHTETKSLGKNWKPEQEERDEMIAVAKQLADIDLSDKDREIREDILDVLASIFQLYNLQGQEIVNLDKLKAVADQLEEPLQEYLEEIL